MHIGLVSLNLNTGGAQRLVLEEANHFAEEGHTVSILIDGYDDDFVEENGLHDSTTIYTFQADNRISKILELRYFCVREDVDIIESHYRDFNTTIASLFTGTDLAIHINGSPFWFADSKRLLPHTWRRGFQERLNAVEGHNEFAMLESASIKTKLKASISEASRWLGTRIGTAVFTISNQNAAELQYLYGCDAELVRPGVSKNWRPQQNQGHPTGFPETDYVLLNVGRLDKRKRNLFLIDVVSTIREEVDVGAVIAGSGEQESTLKSRVDELGLSDVIEFPGYIPDDELPNYYAHADVVTHPAWVAYGIVPLEAILMDTPVAISTDAMVREVIEDTPAVEVIEPEVEAWKNGLKRLLLTDESPDPSVIPLWEKFSKKKLEVFTNNE